MTAAAGNLVLGATDVDVLITAASRAPSLHNSQPWGFAVGRSHIEVYVDASRQLPNADSSGRSLLISCGAALFNIRVTLDHLGVHGRVRLLPDRADATLVAVVELTDRQRPGDLARLYGAVAARRTNRHPFQDRRLPASVLASLRDAAAAEGACLQILESPAAVGRIVDLLRDADLADRTEPARVEERRAWVGDRPGTSDGVPAQSLGPRPTQVRTPFRDLGHIGIPRDHADFEPAPTLAVLSTSADRPVDWVRAGQALQRLLLEATRMGVSSSFMNQPLEQPDLRWLVRDPLAGMAHAQMILRLGYGGPVPATPRRAIEEVRREARLSM